MLSILFNFPTVFTGVLARRHDHFVFARRHDEAISDDSHRDCFATLAMTTTQDCYAPNDK